MKPIKNILLPLDNVQLDHKFWMKELNFARQEIILYEDQTLDFFDVYPDVQKQDELGILLIEFIKLRKSTVEISQQINKHLANIRSKIKGNGELKALIKAEHKKSRELMEHFREEYTALKEIFHRFTAQTSE